ncbi:unnamed protein product [Prunus armeniaca]
MADMLVDGAVHNQMLSFMDGNAGYNQIMVAEEDIYKTAFMCPGRIGAFEYTEQTFKWEEQHQQAFEEIKHYLSNPLVLFPSKRGRPLKLYVSASEVSIGSLLVQDNKEGKEQAVYYLSRTLTEVERKYSAIERLCLGLYFTAVKLRHYMLSYTMYIIAKTDLIKYMLTRPMLRGRIGKWTLAMTEFAFRYVLQKAVKGQAVADFLADHPGEEIENMDSLDIGNADLLTRAHTCLNNPIYSVHLTPWKLYFDGSKTDVTSGAGIVLEEPLGIRHCYSFQLDFQCTNNRAEYEALIIGLEMLVELGIQYVEILGDSMLVLKQIAGEYKCLSPSLAVYLVAARNLLTEFREATWEHIPREENFAANELAQRFGIPESITTDRGSSFISGEMLDMAEAFKFRLLQSTPYYAQANWQAESSNKIIINIIRKMLKKNLKQWHEKLSETLWAYRTSKREATGMTPYALTYGHDAILPMEIAVQSLRIAHQHDMVGENYS